jgi:DNA-binding response OmpR family regulator
MRRKILLADDSPTIQRLVTQTFADSDFDIVSVSNGEAALRKFEDIHPHIVLADIYMPGKNGYEVCAYFKIHAALAATPVILLVGAFDAFDEQTAATAGAAASITKPFEPGALVELVTSVLTSQAPPVETPPAQVDAGGASPNEDDLLGLEVLFKEQPSAPLQAETALSEAEVDRIADRVIQRLSSQVVESIAWEIVPDITEKVLREELKRNP